MIRRVFVSSVCGLMLAALVGLQSGCRRHQPAATRPAGAVLEFRILAERDPAKPGETKSSKPEYRRPIQEYLDSLKTEGPTTRPSGPYRWFKLADSDPKSFPDPPYVVAEHGGARYVLAYDTPDMGLLRTMGWSIRNVRAGRGAMRRPTIEFMLAGRGPKLFGELTGNNIDRGLAVFIDNEAVSVATIRSAIFDSGQITGRFTQQYVNDMVAKLSAGE
jgi:preprotein translocase subunit SecD